MAAKLVNITRLTVGFHKPTSNRGPHDVRNGQTLYDIAIAHLKMQATWIGCSSTLDSPGDPEVVYH